MTASGGRSKSICVWLRVKLWGPFVLPVPKYVYRAVQGPVIVNKSGAYAVRYGGADQLRMVEEYYRLTRARDLRRMAAGAGDAGRAGDQFPLRRCGGEHRLFLQCELPQPEAGVRLSHACCPATRRAITRPARCRGRMVPRNVNPASGFLVNANYDAVPVGGAGSASSTRRLVAAARGRDRHHQPRQRARSN